MKRKVLNRLAINWVGYFLSIMLLISMTAAPAMALIVAANSVNSRSIINGQVKTQDIGYGAVRTSDIANSAVRPSKIANGAVRGNHIRDGHVKSADIGNGTILNADISDAAAISAGKINRFGLNADLLDGSHASAFAASGHDHDSNYIEVTGPQSISDTLTVSNLNYDSAKTRYLSIPIAALAPIEDGYDYESTSTLRMVSGIGTFQAPVYLPQGAIVTKFRYYVLDNDLSSGHHIYTKLYRIDNFQTSLDNMAGPSGYSNSAAWQELKDMSIDYATIDNNSYAYYVNVHLSYAHTSLRAGNIVIEYTYTSPGS